MLIRTNRITLSMWEKAFAAKFDDILNGREQEVFQYKLDNDDEGDEKAWLGTGRSEMSPEN